MTCGVTHNKSGCYRKTDACADYVISQPSPKHCSHSQLRVCRPLAFTHVTLWRRIGVIKLGKKVRWMFCHTSGRAPKFPSVSDRRLGRCPRRRPISPQPCSSRWKRLSSVSKTDQHLPIIHLIWRWPQSDCVSRWYWCSTRCRPKHRVRQGECYAPTNGCTQFWHCFRVTWKCFNPCGHLWHVQSCVIPVSRLRVCNNWTVLLNTPNRSATVTCVAPPCTIPTTPKRVSSENAAPHTNNHQIAINQHVFFSNPRT